MFLKNKKVEVNGAGLILVEKVEDAIKVEKVLKSVGYAVKLVAPPPDLRMGCDLSVECNIAEKVGIERFLKEKHVPFLEIRPTKGEGDLLDIVKIVNFDGAVMVKAGNMKMTIGKKTGIILNTSGGGCPDIPYLNLQLVGKKIYEAERPADLGLTLCALMLDRAFDECLKIWREG